MLRSVCLSSFYFCLYLTLQVVLRLTGLVKGKNVQHRWHRTFGGLVSEISYWLGPVQLPSAEAHRFVSPRDILFNTPGLPAVRAYILLLFFFSLFLTVPLQIKHRRMYYIDLHHIFWMGRHVGADIVLTFISQSRKGRCYGNEFCSQIGEIGLSHP